MHKKCAHNEIKSLIRWSLDYLINLAIIVIVFLKVNLYSFDMVKDFIITTNSLRIFTDILLIFPPVIHFWHFSLSKDNVTLSLSIYLKRNCMFKLQKKISLLFMILLPIFSIENIHHLKDLWKDWNRVNYQIRAANIKKYWEKRQICFMIS